MRRLPVLASSCLLAAALLAVTCGEESTGLPDPRRHESEHFLVLDYAGLSAAAIDSMVRRLEADYRRVDSFLPEFTAPVRITVNILPGRDLPFATIRTLEITQWSHALALDYNIHLLIHLWTRYRKSQFLEEGLGVYGTEVLVPDARTVEPYRGQVPHAWVSLFARNGSLIPLTVVWFGRNVVFEPAGSFVDASAWQFYIEAGSFTRWLFDTYGRDTWLRVYHGADLQAALGLDFSALEQEWVNAARALHPEPLPCETALGTVGQRERFWCALVAGR